MNLWFEQFGALLQIIFKASTTSTFLYIQAGVALLFFLITLHISGWALHVGYATWPRTFLSVILVIGLPLGLALAFQVLASPQLPSALPASWVLGSMIGILLLGVVLPLLTLLLKTGIIHIVMMLAFSTFFAFVAAILILFLAGALQEGARDFSKVEQRRDAINDASSDSLAPTAVKP